MRKTFVTLFAVVGLVIAYQRSPEDSAIRRAVRVAPDVVTALPGRAEQLNRDLRERVRQARDAFQLARSDSEQSLLGQLSLAKQRGSQPPL